MSPQINKAILGPTMTKMANSSLSSYTKSYLVCSEGKASSCPASQKTLWKVEQTLKKPQRPYCWPTLSQECYHLSSMGQKSPKTIGLEASCPLSSLILQNAGYKRNLYGVAVGSQVEDRVLFWITNKCCVVSSWICLRGIKIGWNTITES